jgi:hypothetical protein
MGERKKDLGRAIAAMSVLFLTACASVEVGEKVQIPELQIQCPDPAERKRLEQGATYRDLALSRAEAIAGWSRCFDALNITQATPQ